MAGRIVVAFDKFRGSATSEELLAAVSAALQPLGCGVDGVLLADGGEGSLDVLGGANKRTVVTDPLGDAVEAAWRLDGQTAYIEMAAASGLSVVGGADENDPITADTCGTGELIHHAIELGARTVFVLLGGSATTDGGFGALRAMPPAGRLKEIELVVACDVETIFVDAAKVFGPQKGASPAQVKLLTRRLERLVQVYRDQYGVDVSELRGSGAAGGLAGGLVAVGARIESGFDVLAEAARLDELLVGADLVITGEGFLDDESFNGKVVGGVAAWAAAEGVPVLAVVGAARDGVVVPDNVTLVSLTERFGDEASWSRPLELASRVAVETVRSLGLAS